MDVCGRHRPVDGPGLVRSSVRAAGVGGIATTWVCPRGVSGADPSVDWHEPLGPDEAWVSPLWQGTDPSEYELRLDGGADERPRCFRDGFRVDARGRQQLGRLAARRQLADGQLREVERSLELAGECRQHRLTQPALGPVVLDGDDPAA